MRPAMLTGTRTVPRRLRSPCFSLPAYLFAVAATLIAGVSSAGAQQERSLSRAEARALIAKAPRFAVASTLALANRNGAIEDGVIEAGVREGLWFRNQNYRFEFSQLGLRYFAPGERGRLDPLTLIQPVRREIVEVTGIADAGVGRNLKEVIFRWRYVGLSEVVARYTGQGNAPHESQAILRLYDDGWRVEELLLKESGRVPFSARPARRVGSSPRGLPITLGLYLAEFSIQDGRNSHGVIVAQEGIVHRRSDPTGTSDRIIRFEDILGPIACEQRDVLSVKARDGDLVITVVNGDDIGNPDLQGGLRTICQQIAGGYEDWRRAKPKPQR